MNVSPGDNLSKLITDGLLVNLAPGRYTLPIVLKNRRSVQFLAPAGPVIISVPNDNGVTLNGCSHITFDGIDFEACGENGTYAESCEYLEFHGCRFIKNRHSGLLTAYCEHVIGTKLEASGTIEQHGIYLSSSGDDYTLDGCNCHDNERFGIQINSADRRKPRVSKKVTVTDCESHNNGQGDLQLAAVSQASITGNNFHDSPKCLTMWDDDEGERFASTKNDVINNTFRNSPIGVQIRNHSKGNRIRNNTFQGVNAPLDAKKIKTEYIGNRESR